MDFEQLGRKELQAMAKQYKIKANQSNAALVEALKHALLQDYETSMIEEEDKEGAQQSEKTTETEVNGNCSMFVEEAVCEPQPIIKAAELLPNTAPHSEQLEVNIESDQEIPVSRVISRKRKAVTIVTPGIDEKMVSGPFSIGNVVVDNNSPLFARKKTQETSSTSEATTGYNTMSKEFVLEKKAPSDWKVGDKVQVLIDSVWIASVVKRVNKASFRVQMNSGEETTVKLTDMLQIVEQEQVEDESDEQYSQEQPSPIVQEQHYMPADDEETILLSSANSNNINDASLILDNSIVSEVEPEVVTMQLVKALEPLLQEVEQVKEKCTTTPKKSRVAPKFPSFEVIDTIGTPITSVRSAVKSVRKSTSFVFAKSMTNAAAVSPRRASVQPSWNSSTKPTFHMGSASKIVLTSLSAKKESKTPGSERKKFSITPSRASLAPVIIPTVPTETTSIATASISATTALAPAIMPKMNAAQRMRLEALQKKKAENAMGNNFVTQQNTAFTLASGTGSASLYNHHHGSNNSSQPPLKKARTTPMSTSGHTAAVNSKSQDRSKITGHLPHVTAVKPKIQFSSLLEDEAKSIVTNATNGASTAVVKPKLSTTTIISSNSTVGTQKKATTPNFDRMHQKTFEKQKSLASCVARDSNINKNMDSAFSKASEGKSLIAEDKISTATVVGRENVAPTNNNSTFVTKRKTHVAFAEEKQRKDSDHLNALLIQESNLPNPLIDLGSAEDRHTQKKPKTLSVSATTSSTGEVAVKKTNNVAAASAVNKRKTMGISVTDKTTAAAMASKTAILSRKSEVAPNLNTMNNRKSIRL